METIVICASHENFVPERKTPEAMCWDIKAAESLSIAPGEVKLVKSGLKTFIPTGRCCKIYARSSLPIKQGLQLANSVGLVDSDYRGEYLMQLYNFTNQPVEIEEGARLCQIEFCPYYRGTQQFGTSEVPALQIKIDPELFTNFEEAYPSVRGAGGFWSTGSK